MYKFTGFTQKANDVLNAAIEYAENMGHTYIGSEHLLLGLLEQNGGVAYTVLTNKKLTVGKVEDAVRNSIGFGVPTVLTPGDFTPGARISLKMPCFRPAIWGTATSARSICLSL